MSWQILIVEDDPSFPSELQDMLQMLAPDCEVTVADGGDEATDNLRQTAFDLILLDVDGPDLDAEDFMRQALEESGRDVPVIAVSAFAGSNAPGAAAGFADRLAKPIDLDELSGVLARQLDSSLTGVGA
jgi:CheY-like chemotaxis protein